jgi:hypothetical protein
MALPLIWIVGAGVALLAAKREKQQPPAESHQQTLGEILTDGTHHTLIPFTGAAGEQQRNRFRIQTPPAPGSVAQTPPQFRPTFKPQGFR